MKNFSAVTVSGTSYEARDGILTIHPRNGFPQAIKPLQFKTVDRTTLTSLRAVEALPEADVPELGKSIWAAGIDDWRLSTPVAKVEVHAE